MSDKDEVTELLKMAMDMRESIARLDTKVDRLNEIQRIADEARAAASQANGRLDSVEHRLDDNDDRWKEDTISKRWLWTTMVTIGLAVGGFVLNFLI